MQVRVEDVTYIAGGREILRQASLIAPEGQITAIMGMSGMGKSTILKCIGGLIKPARGRIFIGETDIVPLTERQLHPVRADLGMVFQYAALFDSMTVYENIAFGARRQNPQLSRPEVDRIVAEKLEWVGLEGTQNRMPSELSGGMQKRVGLARALATEPQVLLYDEPTSGLDPIMAHIIDDLIVEMKERLQVTSLVVSHNLESIWRTADRVAMIHEGRIIAEGAPAELQASSDPAVQQFIEGRAEGPIAPGR
ncbi:MAG: ATP-binding cassette domain-containing protein [Armatimonadetes bacterium]|nr:ATP-binding cassette domain-containing protein [Armatimonadota bacterium]